MHPDAQRKELAKSAELCPCGLSKVVLWQFAWTEYGTMFKLGVVVPHSCSCDRSALPACKNLVKFLFHYCNQVYCVWTGGTSSIKGQNRAPTVLQINRCLAVWLARNTSTGCLGFGKGRALISKPLMSFQNKSWRP